MSTEKPILFSAPMVRAILDGRKTQTRRVIKPQPVAESDGWGMDLTDRVYYDDDERGWCTDSVVRPGKSQPRRLPNQPFPVGTRLWVPETWCDYGGKTIYRANYGAATPISDGIGGPWKPSINMPRKSSRITLEITGVRVERVQSISEEDAIAEGIPKQDRVGVICPSPIGQLAIGTAPHRNIYALLWDRINGKRDGASWASNPWVWVIAFRRIKP